MLYTRTAMRQELHWLLTESRHVKIITPRLLDVANLMRQQVAGANNTFQTDPRQAPDETLPENDLETLQFYLVSTSQHFCIWRRDVSGQVEPWQIDINGKHFTGGAGLAATFMRALRHGKPMLDPAYLASMTMADVRELYRDERTGEVTLQMLPQRLAKFNEIGRVLLDRYEGHAANLFRQAGGYLFREDGMGILQQLVRNFPVSYFDWPYTKIAISVARFLSYRNKEGIPTTPEYRELAQVRDPENWEISADYYIPLFFSRVGIFEISDEMDRKLRGQELIERDSRIEREYRACTIGAGRALGEQMRLPLPAVSTEVWKTGFTRCRVCRAGISDQELPCPYRPVCRAYQEKPDLFELRWPLVLTTCY